jgi:hypothetical protein
MLYRKNTVSIAEVKVAFSGLVITVCKLSTEKPTFCQEQNEHNLRWFSTMNPQAGG